MSKILKDQVCSKCGFPLWYELKDKVVLIYCDNRQCKVHFTQSRVDKMVIK